MTAGEIETLLRQRIIAENPPITGSVYFKGMRPRMNPHGETVPHITDPEDGEIRLEDCEVMVPVGKGSELVEGTCIVNIYVPDTLTPSGVYMRNKRRTDELEAWLLELPEAIRDGEVYFKRDGLISTIEEPKTNEHFVSLKMRFKVIENHY